VGNGLVTRRGISHNTQHFDQTTDVLTLLFAPGGGLSSTAAGVAVTFPSVTAPRGIIDPTADGGTAVLPTDTGADTTVRNGDPILFGNSYLVNSVGTIGTGIVVSGVPALLIANTDNPTTDAHWDLIDGVDTANLVNQARTITPGAGLVGAAALDLSADRTLDVGAGNGITVNANDIAVNPAALIDGGAAEVDGDQLNITYVPTNYTPVTTPAEVTATDQLTAHLAAIDAELANSGRILERFVLTAADITAKLVTLANTPVAATVIVHWSEGNHMTDGQGVAVAGDDVGWNGLTVDGLLQAGDVLTIVYNQA